MTKNLQGPRQGFCRLQVQHYCNSYHNVVHSANLASCSRSNIVHSTQLAQDKLELLWKLWLSLPLKQLPFMKRLAPLRKYGKLTSKGQQDYLYQLTGQPLGLEYRW